MKFVNRDEELARLERLAESADGGLAVIWGRRRVGKTRLLLEWCRHRQGLYTVADQSAEPVQRRVLAGAVASVLEGFDEVEYPDWRALLRALARAAEARDWRGPLVLDELPYLVAASPSLPSVLQAWLDHDARRARLAVALAGSAQHMMHGLVLDASAPLYGRAREALSLAPMTVAHLSQALRLGDPIDAVRAFAVLGGIPRYWELAEPYGRDLDEAVDALILSPLGPLHHEPERVLGAEMPPAHALRPLLDAIGAGAHRVSEIGGRLGQPATSLSRPLARLVELGLVRREQPFGSSERGTKRTLYRIDDPFLRAWFALVSPRRAFLTTATKRSRLALWKKARGALLAEAFEDLCRAAVPRLPAGKKGPGQLGPFGPAGRLWEPGDGPEWDVVARSLDGERLLLGEVKWSERPVDALAVRRVAAELERKGAPGGKLFQGLTVIRAVFVSKLARGVRRDRLPCAVIDAGDVVGALG